MAFQGSLSSVNLGDIFQTLAMNRQTGTLSVTHDNGERQHIWFDNGEIAMVDGMDEAGSPLLLQILVHKGLLNPQQAENLKNRMYNTSQPIRELILASNDVVQSDLDDICAWAIEEVVCAIFEWSEGNFKFFDGPPAPELD
jgi:hypothetical protein